MAREAKLEAALRSIETELRDTLRRVLPAVIEGRRTLVFTNRRFNPYGLDASRHDRDAVRLLELSDEAAALREELGRPRTEGPAHVYMQACEEHARLDDPHRLGPRKLAVRILDQLSSE
jgi:hypothetical protein